VEEGFLKQKRFLLDKVSSLQMSAIFLFAGTIVSAGSGFVFWLLAARITNPAAVGIGNGLIASVAFIKSIIDLGLGHALIYFYGKSEKKDSAYLTNTVLFIYFVLSAIAGIIFLLLLPFISPNLSIILQSLPISILFLVFTIADSVLALLDTVMLARKKAVYIFWRNLACNLPCFALLLLFTQYLKSFEAIFAAYVLPNILVMLSVSFFVLPREFADYRFFGTFDITILKRLLPYGLANYLANALWTLPTQILPLIAINLFPAETAGYFAVNFSIANFLLIIPRVITASMFVEGSHASESLKRTIGETFQSLLIALVPAIILFWFLGDFVIGFFGQEYIDTYLLRFLALSTIPFSIVSICFIILKIRNQSRELVLLAFITALIVIGLALYLASSNLGLGIGWLLGYSILSLMTLPYLWRVVKDAG
jgi:O-antigen/teichoic acid export membrane protein